MTAKFRNFFVRDSSFLMVFLLLCMQIHQEYKEKVLNLKPEGFNELALAIFQYQSTQNILYRQYLHYLKIEPSQVTKIEQIPFLPIEFFKSHQILTGQAKAKVIFESSGTTGQKTSQHFVADPDFYLEIASQIFESFYGKINQFNFFALLPSYLERNNSSLVFMIDYFIKKSESTKSGFFLNNTDELLEKLKFGAENKKNLLIGVTFALLDLAESGKDLRNILENKQLTVMETGGMKGRRKELVREEAHQIMTQAFGTKAIHSEYGMTELLSQGYSFGEGIFDSPPSMKILLRDATDPFEVASFENQNLQKRSGGINIIDLANIDSCCFIETKDLGSYHANQTFSVIGRFDNADVRGCNLMVAE